ncbi:FHA domain-containing protein [bacterium]|nr:FHA domain-containing protein [bacterium]
MAFVTIRILEGLERGRVFASLPTPVTIGREDDNDIQLNDDRISRFHAKIQDDAGRVILTDLESTNGTRVNGHPVQMKVLQPGDLVSVGRCVLLFGDLPHWQPSDSENSRAAKQTAVFGEDDDEDASSSLDIDFQSGAVHPEADHLFPHGAPPAPSELRPLHRAQVSDMLAYLHDQLGKVLGAATEHDSSSEDRDMVCPREMWNQLISVQATLAGYLKKIADPD